jgi:hypothetical protein
MATIIAAMTMTKIAATTVMMTAAMATTVAAMMTTVMATTTEALTTKMATMMTAVMTTVGMAATIITKMATTTGNDDKGNGGNNYD